GEAEPDAESVPEPEDDLELDDIETDAPSAEGQRGRASGLTPERAANVAELVRLGREYLDLDPDGTPAGFESWLASTLRAEDAARGADAVDLATFHAAKGLEWKIVHLAGLEDGLVPIHYATTPE